MPRMKPFAVNETLKNLANPNTQPPSRVIFSQIQQNQRELTAHDLGYTIFLKEKKRKGMADL